jgi:hypothetical protein
MFARVLKILPAIAATAAAQVPGAPALQNAFAMPGIAVAANFTGGGGQSFFGAAGAYGMGSGRIQVSGAAGVQRGNGSSRGAYGGRVAASVWTSSGGALGVGAFAGLGGATRTDTNNVLTNPAVMTVPAGLSFGYRRPMGATRGMSVYASPLYRWSRFDNGTVTSSNGSVRVAFGLDFAFSQSLGATIGAELGQNSAGAKSTTGSGTMGAAISFVPGRR